MWVKHLYMQQQPYNGYQGINTLLKDGEWQGKAKLGFISPTTTTTAIVTLVRHNDGRLGWDETRQSGLAMYGGRLQ